MPYQQARAPPGTQRRPVSLRWILDLMKIQWHNKPANAWQKTRLVFRVVSYLYICPSIYLSIYQSSRTMSSEVKVRVASKHMLMPLSLSHCWFLYTYFFEGHPPPTHNEQRGWFHFGVWSSPSLASLSIGILGGESFQHYMYAQICAYVNINIDTYKDYTSIDPK